MREPQNKPEQTWKFGDPRPVVVELTPYREAVVSFLRGESEELPLEISESTRDALESLKGGFPILSDSLMNFIISRIDSSLDPDRQ